jgi:hypothetical protein
LAYKFARKEGQPVEGDTILHRVLLNNYDTLSPFLDLDQVYRELDRACRFRKVDATGGDNSRQFEDYVLNKKMIKNALSKESEGSL